jgi:cation diffusion facilitator CzcD-associated flavoprotein CzcO
LTQDGDPPAERQADSGGARYRVAVVGAGFSGIGLAIRLLQSGTSDFVVFERADDVGGTWRDNTYPGAACDVPSNLYSFSFAPNPSWSSSFSPQCEIEDYLRDCARRFGVVPHVRFGHEVTAASWDDESQHWRIETTRGEFLARVLVSARGPLSEPSVPDLPGMADFDGTIFHSARWDHGHDLRGERVAVIGTGASAIQFVPEIQPEVGLLHVFQRTPPWVVPRHDRRLSRVEHAVYRTVPMTQLAVRAAVYWGRELLVLGFVGRPARRRRRSRVATGAAARLLERQVPDRGLRAKLAPRYELGCKRILLSNDYYPALTRPNVEVVTEAIVEVRSGSVVTADGVERPIDTIVLGTGFDVTAHAAASWTIGRKGASLAAAWARRPVAYKGVTVTGFPNLFLMVGPNSGLGHSSIVFVIESQIAYILDALDAMSREALSSVEVTETAQRTWTQRVERLSRTTVWTGGGCRSYYLDRDGHNVALWPRTSWSYRRATRRFDLEAYRARPMTPAEPDDGARCAGPVAVDDVQVQQGTALAAVNP